MRNKHFLNDDPSKWEKDEFINDNKNHQVISGRLKQTIESMIDEHAYWLKIRGYDEKGLNNNEREGMYKEHLKTAVQRLFDSNIVLLENDPVVTHNFGFFGDEKEKVHFTFRYSYDESEQRLSLLEVQASLNQVPITTHIETFDDLWPSKDLYENIKQISDPINKTLAEQKKQDLKTIASSAYEYLNERGYDTDTASRKGWMQRRLDTLVLKADKSAVDVHYFNIRTKLRSKSGEPIKISIHFRYYKKLQGLTLNWIHAQIGNVIEIFPNKEYMPVPHADNLVDIMHTKYTIQRAQQISEGPKINSQGKKQKR